MVWALKRLQQRSFEGLNKPGKFLAHQLKKKKEKKLINRITVEGREMKDAKDVKAAFLQFYSNLYKGQIEDIIIENYLCQAQITEILEEHRDLLNREISHEEIREAIDLMKIGKAPGPDGLTAKFYKTFKKDLAQVTKSILEGDSPLKTWQEALIPLIPKDEKRCPNVKNFRPISLLNIDYKIFAKIMAERTKKIMERYIGEDQTGFVPGRQIRENCP